MMSNDLHAALFAHLTADVALTTLVQNGSGIIDAMPKPRLYPFARLASVETSDRSTDDARGETHTLLFQIWSRAENRSECAAIAERIAELLVDEAWSAPDTTIICRNRVSAFTTRDRQARAFLCRLRIRLITEPKT